MTRGNIRCDEMEISILDRAARSDREPRFKLCEIHIYSSVYVHGRYYVCLRSANVAISKYVTRDKTKWFVLLHVPKGYFEILSHYISDCELLNVKINNFGVDLFMFHRKFI